MQARAFNQYALKNFNQLDKNLNELSATLEEYSEEPEISFPLSLCFKYLSECAKHIFQLMDIRAAKDLEGYKKSRINNLAQKLLYARQYFKLAQNDKQTCPLKRIYTWDAEKMLDKLEKLFTMHIYRPCFSGQEKKEYEKTKKQITKFAVAHPDKEGYSLELEAGRIKIGMTQVTIPKKMEKFKLALGDIFSELIQRTLSELGITVSSEDPPNFSINLVVDLNRNIAVKGLTKISALINSNASYLSQDFIRTPAYQKLTEQVEFIASFFTAKYIKPSVAKIFAGQKQPDKLLFSFVAF